jgi:hypothetical protein
MHEHLKTLASGQGGVIMRRQAIENGVGPDEVDYLVRRGEWVALRRGAYVDRETHDSFTAEQRHRALIYAVIRRLRVPAVVSHVSAALLHELPVWGLDMAEVHVSRRDLHSPRREAGVHHHAGELLDDEIVMLGDLAVTSLTRTVIDTARVTAFEPSVVVADAAVRADTEVKNAALTRLNQMRDWPGSRNAGAVVEFADGRSESVGESRGRVLFRNMGLPRPELQVEIHDGRGFLIGRADYAFEEYRTLGEFDGKTKYLASYRPGEKPEEVVWREKRREDRMRDHGFEVVRFSWADLDHPTRVAGRFRDAFGRARRRGR